MNKLKRKKKPWVTKGILLSIKKKNIFLRHFTNTKQKFHYEKYRFYRDKINHLLRKSKKDYFSKFFKDNVNNAEKNMEPNKFYYK